MVRWSSLSTERPAIPSCVPPLTRRFARCLPQREVVHLKVFEGMTFQEIADSSDETYKRFVLHPPPDAVRRQLDCLRRA